MPPYAAHTAAHPKKFDKIPYGGQGGSRSPHATQTLENILYVAYLQLGKSK